jgi:hypothetical protein
VSLFLQRFFLSCAIAAAALCCYCRVSDRKLIDHHTTTTTWFPLSFIPMKKKKTK